MNINDPKIRVLFNAKRFMITTILYLRGKMSMAELQKYTGLTWGDLDSNTRILSKYGLIETNKVITGKGPRTTIQLTKEGEEAYEKLSKTLQDLIEQAQRKRRK